MSAWYKEVYYPDNEIPHWNTLPGADQEWRDEPGGENNKGSLCIIK